MKFKNIFQFMVLAVCAVPMASSLSSCTEEVLIDNYSVLLKDSTYFTYNVSNIVDYMDGPDALHFYTYELSNETTQNLKHVKYVKQDYKFWLLEKSSSRGDRVTWPVVDGKNEYRFHYGAGIFRTVALIGRSNINPSMDFNTMHGIMKYPSFDNLHSTDFKYDLYSFDEIFKIAYETNGVMQSPWFSWKDMNKYENADGAESKYVKHTVDPEVVVGYAWDTLKVGEHKAIDMEVTQITHAYNVSLKLDIEDDVNFEVHNIWALCSGVPESVNMYTGFYNVENTHKIPFRFENVKKQGHTFTGDKMLYMTNLSYGDKEADSESVNGPGVLQLIIHGAYNYEGIIVVALCNINKSILDSGIIKKTEKGWAWGGNTNLPITISTKISKDMLNSVLNENKTLILKD